MANVSLYLQYARIAQYEEAHKNRKDRVFKGGVLVPDYSCLLYILQTQIGKRFVLSPSDPTLTATSEYMLSLTGIRLINANPVTTPLTIILNPQSQTVTVGTVVTFTVAATGGMPPYTYQWLYNASPIGGATNPSLTINPTVLGSAGAYDCIVKDSAGVTVTSTIANLVVNAAANAVFAVPVPTDPFPLVSDTYSYTYTQNLAATANIPWNLTDADNNVNWWIFKEPIGDTPKLSYDNGTNLPFADVIPSSVMRAPVVLGGFRYYLTRIQLAYDATQPVTLKTTP